MSFESTKVIEMNKGKQIGNTLMQNASNIPYNNTNVKDALDTINANLSDLLKFEVVTTTVQLNVGETKALEFIHTTPSGYKIGSVTVEVSTGGAYCQVGAVTSDRVFAEVKTVAPAPDSWVVRCRLLYIPTSL